MDSLRAMDDRANDCWTLAQTPPLNDRSSGRASRTDERAEKDKASMAREERGSRNKTQEEERWSWVGRQEGRKEGRKKMR